MRTSLKTVLLDMLRDKSFKCGKLSSKISDILFIMEKHNEVIRKKDDHGGLNKPSVDKKDVIISSINKEADKEDAKQDANKQVVKTLAKNKKHIEKSASTKSSKKLVL